MSNVYEICAHKSGKQKTFDKRVNHVHLQYVYSRLACNEKRNIGNESNVQYLRTLCVLRTMFILADLHTEKRNIGNERNVHGKRLWVFSTKGEKLELPPTSKSLLSMASIFLASRDFFGNIDVPFCLYFQLSILLRVVGQKKF